MLVARLRLRGPAPDGAGQGSPRPETGRGSGFRHSSSVHHHDNRATSRDPGSGYEQRPAPSGAGQRSRNRFPTAAAQIPSETRAGRTGSKLWPLRVLLVCAILAGCERLTTKKAGGEEGQVVVLCEKEIWEEVKPVLSSALEREIFTPTRELVFELRRVGWENFNLYRYRRNLLVIGYLGGRGEVSRLIEQLLTDRARRAVRAGDAHLFGKEDAWADGQLLLVVAASEGSSLSSVLGSQKTAIYEFFDQGATKRIAETIYGQGYQEDTAERLQTRYGWSIHLPLGYRTAEEDSQGNFVSFIRHYPDRLIFVYWDQRERNKISSTLCFSRRNYLGDKYFEGDTIDQDRTETEWLDFQIWRALRVKGIWRNDDKVMGGPFQTYCFYDEIQERFYLVDGHVFAPGRRKLPWLKELDLICQTFKTN